MRAVIRDSNIARACAVALVVLVAGCRTPLPNYDYSKEPDPSGSELTLGVGDQVSINVWENNNLNTEAAIRPDGTITMPLVGDIKATGLTPTALKNLIKTKLQSYVKLQAGNEVTVSVKSWKSYRFTIQGEVGHPGVVTADNYVRVADAIALAGGPSRFAKRNEIVLMRKDPESGKIKNIPIDYDLVASGKRPDMNIFMLSGDTVWVP